MGMYFVKDWYCKPYKKEYQGIWVPKVWNGLTNFDGSYIWTDGDDVYLSNGTSNQYVLNKSTSTWNAKQWTFYGRDVNLNGRYVWTDVENNIYYSYCTSSDGTFYFNDQFELIKEYSYWTTKDWGTTYPINGYDVWKTDRAAYCDTTLNLRFGTVSYYHYVKNKSFLGWEYKSWSGLSSFSGINVWTDGDNIYYNDSNKSYELNKSTSTWSSKTWNGLSSFSGSRVWTDGDNIYYSLSTNQYVLDKATSTWSAMTWTGLTSFDGYRVWKDDDHIYYSYDGNNYELT